MTMCPLLDTTTKAVVSAIEHNWIQYFGIMSILVSDQGPQFRGAEFQAFCERWGIKHNFSLAYIYLREGRSRIILYYGAHTGGFTCKSSPKQGAERA